MSGDITPGDALCALWIALLGQTLPPNLPDCNTSCALSAGDVNADGEVLADDALEMLWYNLLGGNWRPGACGAAPAQLKKQNHSYKLDIGNINGRPGDLITVPLMIDNPAGIDAFMCDLNYPVDLLEYVDVSKTTLTEDWIALAGAEKADGIIALGGFNPEAIEVSGKSTIAEVTFIVRREANGKGTFKLENLKCSLTASSSEAGIFSTDSDQTNTAMTYSLSHNYPNPFNNDTEIEYNLPEKAKVNITVYNISGQKIRTLVDELKQAGSHSVRWNGKDDFGVTTASGIYIYKLESGQVVLSNKMILMK